MSQEKNKELKQQLGKIADDQRGSMRADDFMDYLLGLTFYKYLSEKISMYADELLTADNFKFSDIDETSEDGKKYLEVIENESINKLGYFLKPSELFSNLAERGNNNNFILDDLTAVLRSIEQSTMGHDSEDDFENLFEDLDLTSSKLGKTEKAKNTLISKILYNLDQVDFDLKNQSNDVLGDAYEYLISRFAADAGANAGEFYTPQPVSKLLAKIVNDGKSRLKSVYDPTCGSGSLLLRVAQEAGDISKIYGQESITTTYNLARMNMILHDVHYQKFDIKQEDTLEHPQHLDEKFEAIVANPPYSLKWSADPLHLNDDRFSQYGRLAPKSKADFAFVQHMIHHLAENGTMAVVLAHGVLFRGGAEGHIRKFLIENKNYIDTIIGLPPNMFYGTSIPTIIAVFKKCREEDENILFIDASNEFEKVGNKNKLSEDHIEKIFTTYQKREALDKYSNLASLDEIKENEYNLNIPRYVDTFEEEELVDLDEVSREIKAINAEMQSTNSEIDKFCKELGISTPF